MEYRLIMSVIATGGFLAVLLTAFVLSAEPTENVTDPWTEAVNQGSSIAEATDEPSDVFPPDQTPVEEDVQSPPAELSFDADRDREPGLNGNAVADPFDLGHRKKPFLSSFKLPETLEFAGRVVPFHEWHVRERIEREFYAFLAEEGSSIIMAKRMGRCFPPVETELAEAGLPDDLKYMLLVESKCKMKAISSKGAQGPWQFIRSTAKRYKLKRNRWRDERRNLELSTVAAIKYLSHLNRLMGGDWYLAMASYNGGEVRIRKKLKEQKVDNYWKLHTASETMRYVPRIIAAKEIFSQPEKYLGLSRHELYEPLDTEVVSIRVKKRREHLASIAERHGTYFLELKMLNPELRRSHLPRGKYKLRIPTRTCHPRCDE